MMLCFFGRWNKTNIQNLFKILGLFEMASGLKVNKEKSRLFGINVEHLEVQSMALCLGCRSDLFPFMYLGLPVGDSPSKAGLWKPVLEKVEYRLASWSNNLLSIGGRITLCKSVLDSLPVFYMSLFRLPVKIRGLIDKWRRRFFWGSNEHQKMINWVSWDRITDAKKFDGLGLKNLELFNLSLLGKWKWRLLQDPGALWLRTIRVIHGVHFDNIDRCLTLKSGSIWGKIVASWSKCSQHGAVLDRIFYKSVGDGSGTSFWNDSWGPLNVPLRVSFPRLFALERDKEVKIADRWNWSQKCWGDRWNWRIEPRGRAESEVQQLIQTLNPVSLKQNVADFWSCAIDSSGLFSVNALYRRLIEKKRRTLADNFLHIWNAWIPSKVNVCIWRALQGRLPTRINLLKRGADIPDVLCPLCGKENESAVHVLFECEKVESCWRKLLSWWKASYIRSRSWCILTGPPGGLRWPKKGLKAFHGVCCVTLWSIWKWRNSIVFASEEELREVVNTDIFPSIQSLSFFWFKHRSGFPGPWDWDGWVKDPTGGLMFS